MPWYADMFAMFTMGRPDCLPVGDLGVQKGFAIHFGLKVRVSYESAAHLRPTAERSPPAHVE